MKKLGLIGGVGPEATLLYYKEIEYGVMRALGREELPQITIESLSCFRMIPFGAAQDYDGMTEYILDAVHVLEKADCDFIAMACCTGHMVFDRVQAQTKVPMLSLVESCVAEAKKQGLQKLLLIGTDGTMKDDYFKAPFQKEGISVLVPEEKDAAYVGSCIANELEHGIVTAESVAAFQRIIEKHIAEDNIQAVILGCTELPLLFEKIALPIPALDTTKIHMQDIIQKILS